MTADTSDRRPHRLSEEDYRSLAAFRHAIRRYLSTVSANAAAAGLTHQQHQALLSIRGAYPGRQQISVGELAEHLLIRNHSAVELADRLVEAGLVWRAPSASDRRKVLLSITPKGEATLERLAEASFRELRLLSGVLSAVVERVNEFETLMPMVQPPAANEEDLPGST